MTEGIQGLSSRGKKLEDLFFFRQDAVLVEKKRQLQQMDHNLKTFSGVSGISNEAILRKLLELNVQAEVLATLSIIPLIEVAWADGRMEVAERAAILKEAENVRIFGGPIDRSLFEHWLGQQPPQGFLEAWSYYMQGLAQLLTENERLALKADILGRVRAIADLGRASWGTRARTRRKKEALVLKIEAAFEP
jgi:hypothetical protein